jgi:UbiD family decarboxylase
MWDHIERAGITDVAGVWGFFNGLMIVVSLRQRYHGHARQALLALSGYRGVSSMFRYYVAVDDDIDATNLKDVLWALCTRVDPAKSVEILNHCWTSELDPMVSPRQRADGELEMGRMLIDACKPYLWRDQFPVSNAASPELRRTVAAKWKDVVQSFKQL